MKYFIQTTAILCGMSISSPYLCGEHSHTSDPSEWDPGRVDSHAPLGVMGDHTHGADEFMVSYRFMSMEMDGHRQGNNSLSSAQVFDLGYDIAALDMSMDMHMFGFMYAPSNKLTLMGMINFIEKDMNLIQKPSGDGMGMGDHHGSLGSSFSHSSSGIGDISISGLYKVYDTKRQRVHLNLNLVLPTAGVEEHEHGMLLPYGMQLGSGTWDLKSGLTWLGQAGSFSYGAQAMSTIRLEDENDAGYALGGHFEVTAWATRQLTNSLSTSVRLSYTDSDPINGHFENAHSHSAPPFIQANYGGEFLEGGIGLNWQFKNGPLKGHRFAVEGIFPLSQDLNGIGMERDYSVVAGWQFAF